MLTLSVVVYKLKAEMKDAKERQAWTIDTVILILYTRKRRHTEFVTRPRSHDYSMASLRAHIRLTKHQQP